MSLFLLLANFVGALVAAQLLRGDLSSDENMNFKEIYNSFLAMYQVCRQTLLLSLLFSFAHAHPCCEDFLFGELDNRTL